MLTGGALIVAAAPFFDGNAAPMVAAIALCGIGALALALITLNRR
jgi:DHA1 family bicyclomycin/chloramphenicol resistance-like MFS transporter